MADWDDRLPDGGNSFNSSPRSGTDGPFLQGSYTEKKKKFTVLPIFFYFFLKKKKKKKTSWTFHETLLIKAFNDKNVRISRLFNGLPDRSVSPFNPMFSFIRWKCGWRFGSTWQCAENYAEIRTYLVGEKLKIIAGQAVHLPQLLFVFYSMTTFFFPAVRNTNIRGITNCFSRQIVGRLLRQSSIKGREPIRWCWPARRGKKCFHEENVRSKSWGFYSLLTSHWRMCQPILVELGNLFQKLSN